ncbi:MAG TPA: flagellar filament capping protein FliD [Syntrophorhabdaceae bacterium]|jgi:flagellar hook-associated protein 2
MSGTVSMSGLVSNTNWSALIDSLINAEKSATENPLTESKNKYSAKLSAWQAFNTKLSALTDYIDSNKLNKAKGYNVYSPSLTSTDSSITASSILSAVVGTTVSGAGKYSIEVSQLAKAEKISSGAFASKTDALNLSGDLVINGKAVSLGTDYTLTDVATKINNSNTGVTATVLQVSGTEFRLSLESNNTGSAGISIKNGGSADLLESLKLHTATTQLAHPSGPDALSDSYSNSTGTVGSLLGLSSAQSGTINIKGTDVAVNLATDSLQNIADNINAAAPAGVTASVETVTVNGTAKKQLKLTGTAVTDLTDSNNILETLGVVKAVSTTTLRTGQDAMLSIDGYDMTSSSNSVTSAITGVTLNLTGTNEGKPVELAITQNTSQISTNASTLVSAINNVISHISSQNTFKNSDSAGASDQNPLFGDSTLAQVKRNISNAVFSTVTGNSTFTNASSIGITYAKNGTLSVDTDKLSSAMSTNSEETTGVLKNLSDKLYTSLNGYVDPASGTLVALTKTLQSEMDGIDTRISDLEARYERERVVMEARFNALEQLINTSNSTKSWLTQQASIMNKMNQ